MNKHTLHFHLAFPMKAEGKVLTVLLHILGGFGRGGGTVHSQPVGRHCVKSFVLVENRWDSLKRAEPQIHWKSNDLLQEQVVLLGV